MFPAIARSRALESCVLAAVLALAACASTGPGTAPLLLPGLAPMGLAPMGLPSRVDRKADTQGPRPRRPIPRARVDSAALELAVTKRLAQRPLAVALSRRMRSPEFADRVASAVVYEAGRLKMSPSLLAAVLLIENAPFDTTAVSTQGAIGLMQVMPVHVGSYGCLSGDLVDVEANICHGARLLHTYLRRTKSVEVALRRYNGCVRGRNTPRCHRYPIRVLRIASRLRRETLLAAAKVPDPAAQEQEISSSRLGADLPVPAEDADSAAARASESAACATLAGCLRYRWSLTRKP